MKSLNGVAVVAAWSALAAGGAAHAQEAVQWRVEDGGNGHWYATYIHPVFVSHIKLREQALIAGGHAVTLTSSQEAQFVTQHVITGGADAYPDIFLLGASRVANAWVWDTGEPWGYTNWGGQGCPSGPYPNNGSSGQQIRMPTCPDSWDTETEYHWDDFINEGGRGLLIEWSADCNGDGIVDYGQILDGTLEDANGNGVPDCCDEGVLCSPCPADVNEDGVVNGADISAVLGFWGQAGKPLPAADITRDGLVDGADLAVLLGSWGPCQ